MTKRQSYNALLNEECHCCYGHSCDECVTCKQGRCCKLDDPEYVLPNLGDWEGIIYGDLGILLDDGSRIQCHCCGEWRQSLVRHIYTLHGINALEYKSIFGLNTSQGLASIAILDKWRTPERVEFLHKISPDKPFGSFLDKTPEQQATIWQRPKRPQAIRSMSVVRIGSDRSELSRARQSAAIIKHGKTSRFLERNCINCGKTFKHKWRQTCSDECMRIWRSNHNRVLNQSRSRMS